MSLLRMNSRALRALGLVGCAMGLSGCTLLFGFDRDRDDLQPGDVAGVAIRTVTNEPVPFARISFADGQRRERAGSDGSFVIRDLAEGGWVFRISEDEEDPFGEPEFIAVRQALIRTVPHGLFAAPQKEWVDLGDIVLEAPGSIAGAVIDEDGVAVVGAKVIATRRVLSIDDGFGNLIPFAASQGTIESQTDTNGSGQFLLTGIGRVNPETEELRVYAFTGSGDAYQVSDNTEPLAIEPDGQLTLTDPLVVRPPEEFTGSIRLAFDPPLTADQLDDVRVTLFESGTPPGRADHDSCRPDAETGLQVGGTLELGEYTKLTLGTDDECRPSPLLNGNTVDIHVSVGALGNALNPPLIGALFNVAVLQEFSPIEVTASIEVAQCYPSPWSDSDDGENRDCDLDAILRFPTDTLVADDANSKAVVAYCLDACVASQDRGEQDDQELFVCDLSNDALPANPDFVIVSPVENVKYDCDDDDDGTIDFLEAYCTGLPAFESNELCENDSPDDAGVVDPVMDAGVRPEPMLPDVPLGAAKSAAASDLATCALGADGQAWCWGHHDSVGTDESRAGSRAFAQPVQTNGEVVRLVAGDAHHCVITDDTTLPVSCWGSNVGGQLGFDPGGGAVTELAPVTVGSGLFFEPDGVLDLAAGIDHTCAIVGDGTDNQIVCFGDNADGELGTAAAGLVEAGDAVGLDEPVGAQGVWSAVRAGNNFTLGLTDAGELYCWGDNAAGQCGVGNTSPLTGPAAVALDAGDGPWADVTAGASHACARNPYGDVYCWGESANGQIGQAASSATPVLVQGLPAAASVQAGGAHTCAIGDLGLTLHCWGDNGQGQLGDPGLNGGTSSPSEIAIGRTLYGLSAGVQHTCALASPDDADSTGNASCWGKNLDSQLGRSGTADEPAAARLPTRIHFWLGAVDGSWDDGANWSGGTVPSPVEAAVVDDRAQNSLGNASSRAEVASLVLDASYPGTFSLGIGQTVLLTELLLDPAGRLQGAAGSTVEVTSTGGGRVLMGGGSIFSGDLVLDGVSQIEVGGTVGVLDLTTVDGPSDTYLSVPLGSGLGDVFIDGRAGIDIIHLTDVVLNAASLTVTGQDVQFETEVGGSSTLWNIGNLLFDGTGLVIAAGVDVTVTDGAISISGLSLQGSLFASSANSLDIPGLLTLLGLLNPGLLPVSITGTLELLSSDASYGWNLTLLDGGELVLGNNVAVTNLTVTTVSNPATLRTPEGAALTLPAHLTNLSLSGELHLGGQVNVDVDPFVIDGGNTVRVVGHPFSDVRFGGVSVGANGLLTVADVADATSLSVAGSLPDLAQVDVLAPGRFTINGPTNLAVEGIVSTEAGATLVVADFISNGGTTNNEGTIELTGGAFNLFGAAASSFSGTGAIALRTSIPGLDLSGVTDLGAIVIPTGANVTVSDDLGASFSPDLVVEEDATLVMDGIAPTFAEIHVRGSLTTTDVTLDPFDGNPGARGLFVYPRATGSEATNGRARLIDTEVFVSGPLDIQGELILEAATQVRRFRVLNGDVVIRSGADLQNDSAELLIGDEEGGPSGNFTIEAGGRMLSTGSEQDQGLGFGGGRLFLNVFDALVAGELLHYSSVPVNAYDTPLEVSGGGSVDLATWSSAFGSLEVLDGSFAAPYDTLTLRRGLTVSSAASFDAREGRLIVEPDFGVDTVFDVDPATQLHSLVVADFAGANLRITPTSQLNIEGPLYLEGRGPGPLSIDTTTGQGFWTLNATGGQFVHNAIINRSHSIGGEPMLFDRNTSVVDAESQANGWGNVCGNGIVEPTEECDDSNGDDGDACTSVCALNTAFAGGGVCTWVGAGEPVNIAGGYWSGGPCLTGGAPGPNDVGLFNDFVDGPAELFNGAYSVDTLILRAAADQNIFVNAGATLTVNNLIIEGCDGAACFSSVGVQGTLVVNKVLMAEGGLNVSSGGSLILRGHAHLGNRVVMDPGSILRLDYVDPPAIHDGTIRVTSASDQLYGDIQFSSVGAGAATFDLNGPFLPDNLTLNAGTFNGQVTTPVDVTTRTGAEIETFNLMDFNCNTSGRDATFASGIDFFSHGSVNFDFYGASTLTLDGTFTVDNNNAYINDPWVQIDRLVIATFTNLENNGFPLGSGAGIGVRDLLVGPNSSYAYQPFGQSFGEDHVVTGEVVNMGTFDTFDSGLQVGGSYTQLGGGRLIALPGLEARSVDVRSGTLRGSGRLTVTDSFTLGEHTSFDHHCGSLEIGAGGTGLAIDADGAAFWDVQFDAAVPVTFAAGSQVSVVHGMRFEQTGATLASSQSGETFELDARGDLRVSVDSYTDLLGIGPGFIAYAGTELGASSDVVAPATCGDGSLDDGEECDDGGAVAGDGCSAVCTVEPFFDCSGATCVDTSLCGDGFVSGGEECDDGMHCSLDTRVACTGPADCLFGQLGTCMPANNFGGCWGDCTIDFPGEGPPVNCFGCPSVCLGGEQAG